MTAYDPVKKRFMKIAKTSISDLLLYEQCPYCWYLKHTGYRQKPTKSMLYGTALHKVIENYHKGIENVDDMQFADYLAEYQAIYTPDYQVCEEFWYLPLFDTGVYFTAKVDLVKDDYLIDHKTSQQVFSQEYLDSMKQLTGYSWAWRQQFSQPEEGIKINLFSTNPERNGALLTVLETKRSEEDYVLWESWVREILKSIDSDYFEPNKNGKWHNYPECSYYKDRG